MRRLQRAIHHGLILTAGAGCVGLLAACSGSSSGVFSGTKADTTPSSSPSVTASPSSGSSAPGGALDVKRTLDVELAAKLVGAAAAAKNSVPMGYFTGLAPGSTYYAVDPATGDEWAAGRLQAVKGNAVAQAALTGSGSYDLFRRKDAGKWSAWEVGGAGPSGTPCPATPPPVIAQAWGWPPKACRPPSS